MLRLVYRLYDGENWKNRPSFYSKRLALLSFVRAVEQVGGGVEVVWVNDGPVSPEVVALQRPWGRVVQLPGVGMRRSYLLGLRVPELLGWSPQDVVWFSEDDYLYRPEALVRLAAAAQALPEADYFALYASVEGQFVDEPPPTPRGWWPSVAGVADGVRWVRVLSTASSFGARVGALREDLGIFKFCMVPHKNMYRDHDTCVVVQGFEPHPYRVLAGGVVARGDRTAKRWARDVAMLPFLVATNLRAHRRLENRRLFVGAAPNLATHLEADKLAAGTDWAAVAADVQAWDAARTRPLPQLRNFFEPVVPPADAGEQRPVDLQDWARLRRRAG